MSDGSSSTSPAPIASVRSFEPDARSVRDARRFVRSCLSTVGLRADDAELLTSELVGNVVEHAHTPVTVSLQFGAVIRIEVHDGSGVLPALIDAASDSERGRGMLLVDALAISWGIEAHPGGKFIWVELAAEPTSARVGQAPETTSAAKKQDMEDATA